MTSDKYHKLIDYSKGKYSYHDYRQVKQWFDELDQNREAEDVLMEQWKEYVAAETGSAGSLQHLFQKVHYRMMLEERIISRDNLLMQIVRYAAAILLLPLLGFALWIYFSTRPGIQNSTGSAMQSWVEIEAPEGARVRFMLPDSTSGWLNSGSRMKYPSVFGQQRRVFLSGEGCFDVKHREKSSFVVNVADMDIKVLGTKFNVAAYPDAACTEVVLKEGKVSVDGKTGKFEYELVPGELISYNREKKSLKVSEVNPDQFMAWKDGYLIIDNEPLGQVVERIERWYNAEIVLADNALKNYRFKATFKDEPLEEVLRLIAVTTPIRYRIEKRNVNKNGVTEQKRVFMRLN